jgi:Arc/MetJ-type ribon-helix-helix transcriptional regulator
MDVNLTPDQKAFARRAMESGRLQSEQDVVQEALALWEERERQRTEFLLTLDEARASLARGEGRVITQQSMQQLAQEVKERGRLELEPSNHAAIYALQGSLAGFPLERDLAAERQAEQKRESRR